MNWMRNGQPMTFDIFSMRKFCVRSAPFALLIGAACSGQSVETPIAPLVVENSIHAESGLSVISLAIQTDKATYDFRVEVAGTPQEQARGLMFRTSMGDNEGMIFPRDTPRPASFWMKNTVIPLDIIFIGGDNRVLNIAANTTPYSLDPVPSAGPALAILELNGGRAAQLGIKAGALVSW